MNWKILWLKDDIGEGAKHDILRQRKNHCTVQKCRCKALFNGELADKRVVAKIKKQGWKVTEDGHMCGRCGLER